MYANRDKIDILSAGVQEMCDMVAHEGEDYVEGSETAAEIVSKGIDGITDSVLKIVLLQSLNMFKDLLALCKR